MNVIRIEFRQLAARGVRAVWGDGGAISEGTDKPQLTTDDVLRLRCLGRARGRRHRREVDQIQAPSRISVICGRRWTDAGETQPRSRHLLEIPRLTLRQTRGADGATDRDGGAASLHQSEALETLRPSVSSSCGIRIGHVNAQSLVPKADIINSLLEKERFGLLCGSLDGPPSSGGECGPTTSLCRSALPGETRWGDQTVQLRPLREATGGPCPVAAVVPSLVARTLLTGTIGFTSGLRHTHRRGRSEPPGDFAFK